MKGYCLTCAYFVFDEPSDWKPAYTGHSYDRGDALRRIRASDGEHATGRCSFFPVWTQHDSGHGCGQYESDEEPSLSDTIWGTWQERDAKGQREAADKLRKQLAGTRKISASRLARLQKLEKRKNGHDDHG